jgi:hypothetical protein
LSRQSKQQVLQAKLGDEIELPVKAFYEPRNATRIKYYMAISGVLYTHQDGSFLSLFACEVRHTYTIVNSMNIRDVTKI